MSEKISPLVELLNRKDAEIAEMKAEIAELQAAYEEQAEFIRRYQGEREDGE